MSSEDQNDVPTTDGMNVNIVSQYIRDMSFENPNAPMSLKSAGAQPEMSVNIGMDARQLPKDDKELGGMYEVVLNVRAEAKSSETTVFIAELQYGILVELGDSVPEENHHPFLLIEIPRLAFPFVRQILSDMTQQGGFPPLMLSPVDFRELYMQRFAGEIEKAKEAQKAGGN